MRISIIWVVAIVGAVALVTACNSKDNLVSSTSATAPQSATPKTKQPPADNARRITAKELHALWEKGKVLVVDTRSEPAFKKEHIKGAILIPSPDFPARADELPRDKMIVAYCA